MLDEKVSNEYKAEKQGVFREERAGELEQVTQDRQEAAVNWARTAECSFGSPGIGRKGKEGETGKGDGAARQNRLKQMEKKRSRTQSTKEWAKWRRVGEERRRDEADEEMMREQRK